MNPKPFLLGLLLIAVSTAGCQGTLPSGATARGGFARIPAGVNLADEECRAETATLAYESIEAADRMLHVYCGDWEWPSARLFTVPSESARARRWLADNAWRSSVDARMRCGEAQPTSVLQDAEALVLECKLHNGGWPYIALVSQIGGVAYLADGIPAALPAIERTIAAIAGLGVAPDGLPVSAAVRYLQERLRERMYGARDLQAYYQAMALGQYYNGIKAFSKAERQYWNALSVHQRVLGVDNEETADVLMHIALELSNQEQFSRADGLFEQARGKLDPRADRSDYARYLSYYALHAANQGLFAVARERAQEATEIRERLTTPGASTPLTVEVPAALRDGDDVLTLREDVPPPVETAHSLYVEAAMLERLGELESGDRILQRAQLLVATTPDAPPLWEPQMHSLAGIVEEGRGAYPDAKQARTVASAQFTERAPREHPTALAYLELGKSQLQERDLEAALGSFRSAAELARGRSDSFRLNQLVPYFDALLRAADARPAERDSLYREMFEAAQLVRSGITAHDIARTVARFADREDEVGELIGAFQRAEYARVRKQQAFQAELGRILEAGHVERLDELRQDLDSIDLELEALAQQVQAISPRYRQLIGSAVDVEEVLAALRPREGLLQVLLGDERSFVLLAHDGRITAYSTSLTSAEVAGSVARLRAGIAEATRGVGIAPDAAEPGFDLRAAHSLYHGLFGPIAEDLRRLSHLIAVPSGPLLSYPFGLFVTSLPPQAAEPVSYADAAWLARDLAISVSPSAQSFVFLRALAARSDASKSLLAFGDFTAESGVAATGTGLVLPLCEASQDASRLLFAELPGTARELRAVQGNFSPAATDILLGPAFTEEAVKTASLADYRIVYFATHALLPDQIECHTEPSLVTSRGAAGDGDDDGYLTSGEILDLEMNADLVVLSACNTGGAGSARGESLSGLARAFFFAGARTLLVSHWEVADEATADLMARLFETLRSGRASTLSEALREAQATMLREPRQPSWSHPFFWAAFTLVGDGALDVAGI